jgi:DNA polymerase-3 subunit alpha
MNKKMLESLVKAGAFDFLGYSRAEQIREIDSALSKAGTMMKDRESGQGSFFGAIELSESVPPRKKTVSVQEWSNQERLSYEKELLGFYVTGHPLDDYLPELRALQMSTAAKLSEVDGDESTRLAGLIAKMDVRISQKDKRPWARMLLEDDSGTVEALVFPDTYASLTSELSPGEIIVMTGQVDRREEQLKIRAETIQKLDEARETIYRRLTLHVPLKEWSSERWQELHNLLLRHPGKTTLHLCCRGAREEIIELEADASYGVGINSDLCRELRVLLGKEGYALIASKHISKPKIKKWARQ